VNEIPGKPVRKVNHSSEASHALVGTLEFQQLPAINHSHPDNCCVQMKPRISRYPTLLELQTKLLTLVVGVNHIAGIKVLGDDRRPRNLSCLHISEFIKKPQHVRLSGCLRSSILSENEAHNLSHIVLVSNCKYLHPIWLHAG
jgi:hypothetical protein